MSPQGARKRTFLRRCCVCCTGFPDEEQVQAIRRTVLQASGTFQDQLDENVTHLVAASAGSEKHRKASSKEFRKRIVIVKPSWVAECENHRGDKPPETAPHLLRCLEGMRIGSSGFKDNDLQTIISLARKCGGTRTGSFQANNSHLVAKTLSGAKVELARRLGIPIVSIYWLRQCFETKALLDESRFPVSAVARRAPSDVDSTIDKPDAHVIDRAHDQGSIVEELSGITPSFALESCCIFLVPSLSEAEEGANRRRGLLMRLAALAGGTVSPRWSSSITHAVVVAVPLAPGQVTELRNAEGRGVELVDAEWIRRCAEERIVVPSQNHPPQTWSAPSDANSLMEAPGSLNPSRDYSGMVGGVEMSGAGGALRIFLGVRLALGPLAVSSPELCSKISGTVVACRGKVLPHDANGVVLSGTPTHILCPPSLSSGVKSLVETMRSKGSRVELVTQTWVEQCINERRLLAASSCILFTAREYSLPIKDFAERNVVLSISGLMSKIPNPDWNRRRDVVVSLARMLGAKYSDRMRRHRTTHLVVDSSCCEASDKMKSAFEWGIPVVSEQWLLACAFRGCFVAIDDFIVHLPSGFREEIRAPEGIGNPFGTQNRTPKRERPVVGPSDQSIGTELPPRKSARRTDAPTQNMSAEALLQQLGDKLVEATRVGTEAEGRGLSSVGSAAGVAPENGEERIASDRETIRSGDRGQMKRRGSTGGNLDDSLENVLGDGQDLDRLRASVHARPGRMIGGQLEDAGVVEPRRSEWSLEASQSQLIVHRDLTPPPAPLAEPKAVPKLRRLPSRAVKAQRS